MKLRKLSINEAKTKDSEHLEINQAIIDVAYFMYVSYFTHRSWRDADSPASQERKANYDINIQFLKTKNIEVYINSYGSGELDQAIAFFMNSEQASGYYQQPTILLFKFASRSKKDLAVKKSEFLHLFDIKIVDKANGSKYGLITSSVLYMRNKKTRTTYEKRDKIAASTSNPYSIDFYGILKKYSGRMLPKGETIPRKTDALVKLLREEELAYSKNTKELPPHIKRQRSPIIQTYYSLREQEKAADRNMLSEDSIYKYKEDALKAFVEKASIQVNRQLDLLTPRLRRQNFIRRYKEGERNVDFAKDNDFEIITSDIGHLGYPYLLIKPAKSAISVLLINVSTFMDSPYFIVYVLDDQSREKPYSYDFFKEKYSKRYPVYLTVRADTYDILTNLFREGIINENHLKELSKFTRE